MQPFGKIYANSAPRPAIDGEILLDTLTVEDFHSECEPGSDDKTVGGTQSCADLAGLSQAPYYSSDRWG